MRHSPLGNDDEAGRDETLICCLRSPKHKFVGCGVECGVLRLLGEIRISERRQERGGGGSVVYRADRLSHQQVWRFATRLDNGVCSLDDWNDKRAEQVYKS